MVRSITAIAGVALALVASQLPLQDAAAQGSYLDRAKGLLGTTGTSAGAPSSPSSDEIGDGLREALRVGTERVVGQLGTADGFNADPDVHIPLPRELQGVQAALGKVGMSGLADEVELKLNRAAEAATPKAKEMFRQSISAMTLEDVQGIYEGPDDSATRYFRGKMAEPLKAEMRPVVEQSLAEVGAVRAYDAMMGRYGTLPFMPDAKADLTEYGLDKTLDGIFFHLAREEKAIRQNPAARTTELLQKVFGGG
ncbi:MAG: DUF4197 domain-containing protein [Rhodospirillales bacterium]